MYLSKVCSMKQKQTDASVKELMKATINKDP